MDVSVPHTNPYASSVVVKRRFTGLQLTIGGGILACAAYIYWTRTQKRKQGTAAVRAAVTNPTVPNPTLSSTTGQLPAAISTNT